MIDNTYYPLEISKVLTGLAGLGENERSECEDAIYNLMAIAENKYNDDCYRTLWSVFQALCEKNQNLVYGG